MCIPKPRQGGVTLIETVVFIVVISIAVMALLQLFTLTTRSSADPVRRKQALLLAEALLEEVQLAKFTYCDPTDPQADSATSSLDCTIPEAFGQAAPEPAGTRPFDNINDYVAAANTATAAFESGGVLMNAAGTPFGLTGYTARLTITPQTLGQGSTAIVAGGSSADVDVLRITVSVAYGNGESVVLDGFRTRYAPNTL